MKTIRTLIWIGFVLTATTSFAQQMENRPLMKVNIPFQFMIGEHAYPAGEYVVTSVIAERTLRISSAAGNLTTFVAAGPLYAQRPSGSDHLIFNRYGKSYFLAEVWTAGADVARSLGKGKWETEVASKRGNPESTTVLAEMRRR